VTSDFVIQQLSERHDRTAFSSGVDALDRYLKVQAGQDIRRNFARCLVATPTTGSTVVAYYTLAATSISVLDLPDEIKRRLPRYQSIPAALIGRLAVDRTFRRRGLGTALLVDAVERALKSELAAFALVVDAKDEAAARFYRRHQFQPLQREGRTFFLPLAEFRSKVP
jgi:ribosomal protein S18 acetylase RimI-like enzyme